MKSLHQESGGVQAPAATAPRARMARAMAWLLALAAACGSPEPRQDFQAQRMRLVDDLAREIRDPRILAALGKVPRERFVPEAQRARAYEDSALPIGLDQTISQPFVVAFMSEALRLEGGEKVLEVGTGSGYQAAVLAELAREVYSIEILEPLARRAEAVLTELGYDSVHVRVGDGYRGWPEEAPFDAIIVTAAPDHVPQPLVDQLAVGGRMVLPVGGADQELRLIERTPAGVTERRLLPVRFVPMTGEAQRR
jgi:protein-L-isoaspartate(D-aspartate) O-methyltransferase